MPKNLLAAFAFVALSVSSSAQSADAALAAEVNRIYPEIEKLYIALHQAPELSLQEEKTSATMANGLRSAGFEVTTNVGGHGVVGILRNGPGPVVMLRTDMDALPVEEKTGLPYASHEPAEERVVGAKNMLKDGLFTRFPKPDIAFGIHDDAWVPAGTVAIVSGYLLANSDSINITIYGKGAHGSAPHAGIDPIVIAARTILGFQSLVAREKDPQEPGVVTVGAIHGGTKSNIIPDQVQLQLSVRSFTDAVRQQLLDGIARIAKAEAAAAGAPREPDVKLIETTHATYNDPALARRMQPALAAALGASNVIEGQPVMGSEDFSEFVRAGVPGFFLRVGAVNPAKYSEVNGDKTKLPSLHSALFAPDREPTLRTSIASEVAVLRELLKKK